MILPNAFFTLAQAAPAAQGQQASPLGMFIPMICIGVIFYFLMIRPQQKKAKELNTLIASAKTGDKIITAAGIHGMITNVKDTTVMLKIDDNVKIEIEKTSIATVVKRKDEAAA
jgi:preprotein translocase subunit YajC